MTTVAHRSDRETSADFVMPENRRRGLYIRSYRTNGAGGRYDDSGVITVDPGAVSAAACHPSARWPPCACGQGGH